MVVTLSKVLKEDNVMSRKEEIYCCAKVVVVVVMESERERESNKK